MANPTYEAALAWLEPFVNYEQIVPTSSSTAFDLARMRHLMAALGHPERQWPSIHVAGTKGKGSTCALLAAILQAAGYRVGLYTSPHLVNIRERIQLNGQWVSELEFAEATAALHPAITHLATPPTYFEVFTAMAFWLMARWRVEMAVVEVGLGGRLDATNVVNPLVSVITPLSDDHTDLLGTTLAAIAAEKAGIIKPGCPVVTAPQPTEALDVIRRTAGTQGVPCVEVGQVAQATATTQSVDGQQVSLRTSQRDYPMIFLPLLGAHQTANLATAVTALETLPPSWTIAPDTVVEGAARVRWPGRLQILERSPWVVVDGAQNAASAAALREAVRAMWPGQAVHLVLGVSANKDLDGIASALAPLARSVIATQAQTPRALSAPQLAARLRAWCAEVQRAETVTEAVALARRRAGPDDVILVTGSLFLVGELLQSLELVAHG